MRVLIFIGLKVAEIVAFALVVATLIAIIVGIDTWVASPYFWASFEAFWITAYLGAVFCYFRWIIKLNWEWAGKITDDMRKKK